MEQHYNTYSLVWQKLKNGSTEALGQLYDVFIDDLFDYGCHFSQDKSHIMDCIHDLFLNLYKYRKKLADTDNVKSYLFRSLKNQILKKPKEKFLYLPFLPSNENDATYSISRETEIIETEFLDEQQFKLSEALGFLSKKQRHGIFLRFSEECQYEEIAQIMNVSVETSRTIIYRAIKVLRNHLCIFLFLLLNNFF